MKKHQTKLSVLITAGVILCTVVATLSLLVINSANKSMTEEHIKENMSSMQLAMSRMEKDIDTKFNFVQNTADTLSNDNRSFEYISDAKNISKLMSGSTFYDFFTVDPSGMAYSSDGRKVDVSDRLYFKKACDGKSTISERLVSRFSEHDKEVVVYAAPVISNYRLVAVVCGIAQADIDLSNFTDANSGDHSGMYVLDRGGRLVMSSLDNGRSFYDSIRDSKYSDGTSSGYQLVSSSDIVSETGSDCYCAGDITDSKGFWGWLGSSKNTSKIFFKKTLDHNGWTLFCVRSVELAESTVSFIIISHFTLFGVVLIFLAALIVMLLLQKRSNDRITELAYKDEVTGRANWQKFVAVSDSLINRPGWWSGNYAAMHIDINRFTLYNDIYGHEAGDNLLKSIAETFDQMSTGSEICARRGSDKFVALWTYVSKGELDERLNSLFEQLNHSSNGDNFSLTVGVYPMNEDDRDIVHAIDLAKMAADKIIDSKKNEIVYFDEPTRMELKKEHELESLMQPALENGEFKLYLQPKHGVQSGRLEGAEALVRWISPTKGFISPGEFIPLFEKNGFVADVDNYILEQLCIFQRKRLDSGLQTVPISVNVSRVQLSDPNLAEEILKIVEKHNVPHKYIDIELTESACFDDMEVLVNTIEKLGKMGFAVSMDDFGSGYSSLNLLKELPFDTLKIDGEFFRNISDLNRANIVVKTIIELAKSLKMKVVAEGIETAEQVEFLRTTECDMIQGYYYSKPISADEFEKYISANM